MRSKNLLLSFLLVASLVLGTSLTLAGTDPAAAVAKPPSPRIDTASADYPNYPADSESYLPNTLRIVGRDDIASVDAVFGTKPAVSSFPSCGSYKETDLLKGWLKAHPAGPGQIYILTGFTGRKLPTSTAKQRRFVSQLTTCRVWSQINAIGIFGQLGQLPAQTTPRQLFGLPGFDEATWRKAPAGTLLLATLKQPVTDPETLPGMPDSENELPPDSAWEWQ